MPLNHELGEVVEGMDSLFHVVPMSKYAEQTRLTTIVKRVTGRQFRRETDVEMPIFRAAMEHAQAAFMNSGIMPGSNVECLAQEYPRTGHVCFIFSTMHNGEEKLVVAPFKLARTQIADLTLRDLWQPYTLDS